MNGSGSGGVGNEDKPFECQQCGMKYKTRPGLTYHRKTHCGKANGTGTSSSNQNNSHAWNHTGKSNDALLNPDESTTNSMFETHGYDDINSSSNMSHTTGTAANHNGTASNQAGKHLE